MIIAGYEKEPMAFMIDAHSLFSSLHKSVPGRDIAISQFHETSPPGTRVGIPTESALSAESGATLHVVRDDHQHPALEPKIGPYNTESSPTLDELSQRSGADDHGEGDSIWWSEMLKGFRLFDHSRTDQNCLDVLFLDECDEQSSINSASSDEEDEMSISGFENSEDPRSPEHYRRKSIMTGVRTFMSGIVGYPERYLDQVTEVTGFCERGKFGNNNTDNGAGGSATLIAIVDMPGPKNTKSPTPPRFSSSGKCVSEFQLYQMFSQLVSSPSAHCEVGRSDFLADTDPGSTTLSKFG